LSTASVGKKYERELVNKLRDYFPTERVPRSVADASQVDDVIVWPYFDDLPDAVADAAKQAIDGSNGSA